MLIEYSMNLQNQFTHFRELRKQDLRLSKIMSKIEKKIDERFIILKGYCFR